VNVYELRIAGVASDARLAAARWGLFVFREVRRVYRIGTTDHVAMVYEGAQPDVRRWVAVLEQAGYAAEALEEAGSPLEAA
jgi:20S proteasome alpha/beta subunit